MSFDPKADLQALKDELVADPLNLYEGDGVNHDFAQADADAMNAVDPQHVVNNASVVSSDIKGATTYDAFDGLAAGEERWFIWLTDSELVPVNDDTLETLAGVGGNSRWATADRSLMEPRMLALMQRDGSRAEVLFGIGSNIKGSDISNAINLP